jgi:D-xylose 1-dehydrogenase (NADP+, D-xylono-1,5-lactone-forming)
VNDVGWGVLGAGWLVKQATAAAIHQADGARLVAAGARDRQRAESIGPDRAYDDYRAVIEDPGVEAVYIALANDAHLPWIRATIAAGKHVLCEKPMVLSEADARAVFAEAEAAGVLLVEAAWAMWHPRMRRIVELAVGGALGEITAFLGTFTFDGVPSGNYRLSASRGGGALYDVGIYPLHALSACLPDVDRFVVTDVDVLRGGALPDDGVDLTTKAALAWTTGTRASVVASFVMPESQRLEVRGTTGRVRVDDDQAFTSWRTPSQLRVGEHVEEFPAVDAYQVMVEQVSARIRGRDVWVLPARDSVRVAGAVDAIRFTEGLRTR